MGQIVRDLSPLSLVLLMCALPVWAQTEAGGQPAADTSRAAVEAWLLTELPRIRVHYGDPIPPFDRSSPGRGRFGDHPTSRFDAPPPTDEQIARVTLDGCQLEVEQRFDGDPRVDPVAVVSTVPLNQIDSTSVQVENRPSGPYAGNGWPNVLVRAPTDILKRVWVHADGRRLVLRSDWVALAMPSQRAAEGVVAQLRREVTFCRRT